MREVLTIQMIETVAVRHPPRAMAPLVGLDSIVVMVVVVAVGVVAVVPGVVVLTGTSSLGVVAVVVVVVLPPVAEMVGMAAVALLAVSTVLPSKGDVVVVVGPPPMSAFPDRDEISAALTITI